MMDSQEQALNQGNPVNENNVVDSSNETVAQPAEVEVCKVETTEPTPAPVAEEPVAEEPAPEPKPVVEEPVPEPVEEEPAVESAAEEPVAEPVAEEAEEPAAEPVEEAPAPKKTYKTKKEVLERVTELAHGEAMPSKEEVDLLKTIFYKLHIAEREAALKEFIDGGGNPDEYQITPMKMKRNSRQK